MSDPIKMHAVIVVNLPTTTREEYEWALDQIERAATPAWGSDVSDSFPATAALEYACCR